ncbi:hypothetical protein VNO77_04491 [Canavalia gladiata]|uniref:Uncharacterized protein n=1 Tax=Canavalia gladiata TaxID=3824 RepID=A0AAN9MWL3_CANGL
MEAPTGCLTHALLGITCYSESSGFQHTALVLSVMGNDTESDLLNCLKLRNQVLLSSGGDWIRRLPSHWWQALENVYKSFGTISSFPSTKLLIKEQLLRSQFNASKGGNYPPLTRKKLESRIKRCIAGLVYHDRARVFPVKAQMRISSLFNLKFLIRGKPGSCFSLCQSFIERNSVTASLHSLTLKTQEQVLEACEKVSAKSFWEKEKTVGYSLRKICGNRASIALRVKPKPANSRTELEQKQEMVFFSIDLTSSAIAVNLDAQRESFESGSRTCSAKVLRLFQVTRSSIADGEKDVLLD